MRNLLPLFLYFASLLPALSVSAGADLPPPRRHVGQLELLLFVCDFEKNFVAELRWN